MKKNIQYRPDIDGLRGLTLIAIVIFHWNSSFIPGAFIGVDIFFVISGFLITSIISRHMQENRFTFKDFYARRIKRILPLFFTVLLTVLIVAAILFSTKDYENFWRTVKYSMQFRANRAFTGQGYFDPISEEKPLLNLWSLAIEEQFYFIWPLILFGIYKITKSSKSPYKWAFWICIFGIIASVIYTQYRLGTQPGKAYYQLSTRASELLVGCALALTPYHLNSKWKQYLGFLGFIVLILCYIFYNSKMPFPGATALIPTIAAAFFIADNNVDSLYKKLFTNKFSRTMGLWSFSLYLWHWPIMAFMRYILNDTTIPPLWMLFAVILMLLLTLFSYYLIENPIRKSKLKFSTSLLLIYILPALAIVGIHQLTIHQPLSRILSLDDPKEVTEWAESNQVCMDSPINNFCFVGDLHSNKTVLVIGDSHAAHLANFVDIVGKKEHFKAHMIASGGCGFPPSQSMINVFQKRPGNTCLEINEYLLNDSSKYDAVIISQYLTPKLEEPSELDNNYRAKFRETVNTIASNNEVYLISDLPTLSIPSAARYTKLKKLGIDQYLSQKKPKYSLEEANNYLKEMANKHANVYYIDISSYIPDSANYQGVPMYFDDNHLNLFGSKKIGELFIQDKILLQK